MVRTILGVIFGCLIGLFVTGAVDGMGNMLYPPPAEVNLTDPQALRAALPKLAIQAKVVMVLAAFFGVLAGASAANMIAGRRRIAGLAVGAILVALGIFNMVTLRFPPWMITAEILAFAAAILVADRAFGQPKP
jgi:hypothetical protein